VEEVLRTPLLGLRYDNGSASDARLDSLATEARRRGLDVLSYDRQFVYIAGFQWPVVDALRKRPKLCGVRVTLIGWADDVEI
jgi:hypothetical protein